MDKFFISAGKYITERIDLDRLMNAECNIIITQKAPMISMPQYVSPPLSGINIFDTELRIDFGTAADGVFADAMKHCFDCMDAITYDIAMSTKRLVFNATEFQFTTNDVTYAMVRKGIVVHLCAPLIEPTSGSILTMIVKGRAYVRPAGSVYLIGGKSSWRTGVKKNTQSYH